MILYWNNTRLIASKCKQQKFSSHVGRKWINAGISINNKYIPCTFDLRFGKFIYFKYGEALFRISMYSEYCDPVKYSFNPLSETVEFSTDNNNKVLSN